jgi:hypothetical protein
MGQNFAEVGQVVWMLLLAERPTKGKNKNKYVVLEALK